MTHSGTTTAAVAGVLGGGVLKVDDYAAFLGEHYLGDYLAGAGRR